MTDSLSDALLPRLPMRIGSGARLRLKLSWLPAEPALRRFVMILERDHQALHRTQGTERDHQDQWQPQRCMYPIRRVKQNFGDERGADHNRTSQEHDEDGRAVTGIGEAVTKPATLAVRP